MAGEYLGPNKGSSLDLSGSTSVIVNALAPEIQSFIISILEPSGWILTMAALTVASLGRGARKEEA